MNGKTDGKTSGRLVAAKARLARSSNCQFSKNSSHLIPTVGFKAKFLGRPWYHSMASEEHVRNRASARELALSYFVSETASLQTLSQGVFLHIDTCTDYVLHWIAHWIC